MMYSEEQIQEVTKLHREFLDFYQKYKSGELPSRFLSYPCGMVYAAYLAKLFGYKKLICLEFGVAPGALGLKELLLVSNVISKIFEIDFKIYGFDRIDGMPDTKNVFDHLEIWYPGQFGSPDLSLIDSRITLIEGDVKETVPKFIKSLTDEVIGFMIFDLDLYSSTKDALEIAKIDFKNLMPITPIFVDDIQGLMSNPWQGVFKAINDFNEENINRKIDLRSYREHDNSQLSFLHVFDHPIRTGQTKNHLPIDFAGRLH